MFKKQDTSDNSAPTSLRPGGSNSPTLNHDSSMGNSSSNSAPTSQASIGPSIRINGDITGDENIIIHGKVSGSISLPNHTLTIGKQGSVDADVSAKSLEIEGKVAGTVQAAEIVRVRPSGEVRGDICAPRVVLEDGCQFRGGIEMQEQKVASKPQIQEAKPQTNGAAQLQKPNQNKLNLENTAKAS